MKPVYPSIPEFIPAHTSIYEINTIQYWGFFSKHELIKNKGRLLMLDIDFGRKCSLACPTCFRKDNQVDDNIYPDLSYSQLVGVIDAARGIGLQSVKICGAGEPLEHPKLLQFVRDMTQRGIGTAIFTKGHVLGNDLKVSTVYESYGIQSATELCSEFFKLKSSFMVSFQSAFKSVQDDLVGRVNGYSEKRNRALELLAEAGFNKTMPTRLAMCSNPITRANYQEIFDIYVYARARNILPVAAALMVSGKQFDNCFLQETDVTNDEKEALFQKIYKFNLANGYSTEEQLRDDGISCLPGIHPCNQIARGLYLTSNGNIIRCPGDTGKPLGNVQDEGIASIWAKHKDWEFTGQYNCGCPYKDGITLPTGIYEHTISSLFGFETFRNNLFLRRTVHEI